MAGNYRASDHHRQKIRAIIAKGHPPCALCGGDIDYEEPYPAPGSFTVDHIIPVSAGGTDELANLQPAHAACNNRKSGPRRGTATVREMDDAFKVPIVHSGSFNVPGCICQGCYRRSQELRQPFPIPEGWEPPRR